MMSEMVCLQGIAERSRSDANSRKGCLLGHRDMPREFLAWSCAEFSAGRGRKMQERNEDNLRRSVGMDGGENRFLGGSDPTLSGFSAAQRLRRRGSLPPKLSSRLPRSVAGREVGEEVSNSESRQQQENRIWP